MLASMCTSSSGEIEGIPYISDPDAMPIELTDDNLSVLIDVMPDDLSDDSPTT